MVKILSLLLLSFLGGVLNRLGGWEKGNRLFRILGIPIITLYIVFLQTHYKLYSVKSLLPYILTFGLTVGAVSAYWGQDEKKWGFYWHGLGIALATCPTIAGNGHPCGFLARLVVLPVLMALWSEKVGFDIIEEFGRGALIILTLPLLML